MTNLDDVIDSIDHIGQPILAGIFIVSGFFICLWGAKFFKQVIFLIGFVGGTLFTYFMLDNFDTKINETTGDTIDDSTVKAHLLISAGVGLFVGFVCVMVYKASVFVTGAIVGIIVGQAIWQFLVMNNTLGIWDKLNDLSNQHMDIVNTVFIIIFAIVFGFAAFKIIKIVLKVLTAFLGAFIMACGIGYYLQKYWQHNTKDLISMMEFWETPSNYVHLKESCDLSCYISITLWFILFISGVIHQYRLDRKDKEKSNQLRPEYQSQVKGNNNEQHIHYHVYGNPDIGNGNMYYSGYGSQPGNRQPGGYPNVRKGTGQRGYLQMTN